MSAGCPNCGSVMAPDAGYCSTCGQAAVGDNTFGHFLHQFLGDYFTFDSKITRSLRPLLFKPGELTLEYIRGRRQRYVPPLRLFIFLSVLFFLVMGSAGASRLDGEDELLREQLFWDNFFASVLPKLFFLFLPLFAGLVHLLHREKGGTFVKPFIFSAHYHSFVFLVFGAYGLISRLLVRWDLVAVNQVLILVLLLWALAHLYLALRRAFRQHSGRQVLSYLALLLLYASMLAGGALGAAWVLA
ncbi:MAG: DUF3667 domain-containing protein [Flavobacteriales bacterium]|nr:MAG: DUF3667 domain-containing protein [Flavobacteriales bacterium]